MDLSTISGAFVVLILIALVVRSLSSKKGSSSDSSPRPSMAPDGADPEMSDHISTKPGEKSILLRMDMRGPSRAADCLDGVVAFPGAVERMRAANDAQGFPDIMVAGTEVAFRSLESCDRDGLLFVASSAQDLLYRYIMQLSMIDHYTRVYCAVVIRCFFLRLSQQKIRTFYILDNTLREDRFAAVLELFDLSGIATTTPGRDGTEWPTLSLQLLAGLDAVGHVAYIEPDASVNHLEAAQKLAGGLTCVATFRNLAPDDPQLQIITLKAS